MQGLLRRSFGSGVKVRGCRIFPPALVDLDGAKASSVVNCDVLERICAGTSLKVDFGGGVKSDADIRRVFDSGARMACIGSVAYTDPALGRRCSPVTAGTG